MLKLLERTIQSLDNRLVLLAPTASVPGAFSQVHADAMRHSELLREMQRLRGQVYLRDGAIRRKQLSADGRHETPEDHKSWHLLMLNARQAVSGCAWYLEHESSVRVHHLRVRHSPLVDVAAWRDKLFKAVESEIEHARRNLLRYAEVGGWAVAHDERGSSDGLLLALAGFSLGALCGGCLALTTATVRHCSSSILKRLGGGHLEVDGSIVPSYYDPAYRCEMEILRFDSRRPNPKYADLVGLVREQLAGVQVIARPCLSDS